MRTGDRLILWAAAVSVLTVTAIAVVISYGHTYELVLRYGESGTTAKVLPLTVDGLIATCSLVLLDCARRNRRPPWHAWALLALGMAATLGANIDHGLNHGLIGALVAGWPAIVAIGAFELLIRLIKDTVTGHSGPNQDHADQDTTPPAGAETKAHPAGVAGAPGPTAPDSEDGVLARAQEHFADILADGQLPSIRALKRQLHLGHTRATQIRQALADSRPGDRNTRSSPDRHTSDR
jgi:hypothetical protein